MSAGSRGKWVQGALEDKREIPGALQCCIWSAALVSPAVQANGRCVGRATEELHRQYRPAEPRRDGTLHFDGKILVDDMVLVEPVVGLRPWVSSEVYEEGVKKLLGEKAVNAEKDMEEGAFNPAQLVWGVYINADEEEDVSAGSQDFERGVSAHERPVQFWRKEFDPQRPPTL